MKAKMTISWKEYENILDYVTSKLRDPNQQGGAWFNSEEEFEEWAGDVFDDVVNHTLSAVGIELEEE